MRKTNVIAFIVASAVTIVVFCAALFLLLNAGASTEPIRTEAEVSTSAPTSAPVKDFSQAPPEAVRPNSDPGPGFNTNAGSTENAEPTEETSESTKSAATTVSVANSRDRDAVDEAVFRADYIRKMTNDPYILAEFLYVTKKLSGILNCDDSMGKYREIIAVAARAFNEDAELHREALGCAKEVYLQTHIDCDWIKLHEKPTAVVDLPADGSPLTKEEGDGLWGGPVDK